MNIKAVLTIVTGILLLSGLLAAVMLSQQSQLIAPKATVEDGLVYIDLDPNSSNPLALGDFINSSIRVGNNTSDSLYISGVTVKLIINFDSALNVPPVSISSFIPNEDLSVSDRWNYEPTTINQISPTSISASIIATNTRSTGHLLSANESIELGIVRFVANHPGIVSVSFDSTETKVLAKNNGQDILTSPPNPAGTFTVLDDCNNTSINQDSCTDSPITDAIACILNSIPVYCCQAGQEVDSTNSSCESTVTPTPDLNISVTPTPSLDPTITATPTPTTDPLPQATNLTVTFRLQGITTATQPQDIELRLKDNTPVTKTTSSDSLDSPTQVTSTTSDETGIHSAHFTNITPGSYKMCLKAKSHLQKCFSDTIINSGDNTIELHQEPDYELLAGDVTGKENQNNTQDNIITLRDLSAISSMYTDYVVENKLHSSEDINHDGRITIIDLALAYLNFGYFEIPGEQ